MTNAFTKALVLVNGNIPSAVLLAKLVQEKGVENVVALYVDYFDTGVLDFIYWQRVMAILEGYATTLTVSTVTLSHNFFCRRNNDSFVPFECGISLSLGVAEAYKRGIRSVYHPSCRYRMLDGHKTDDTHFNVPFANATVAATEGQVTTIMPLEREFLEDVIKLGKDLNVDFSKTWSCMRYENEVHCGKCTGCLIRKAAFDAAGIEDPVTYV